MERFSVGRTFVREALQWLGTAGLIEISHAERARVAVPNTHNLPAVIHHPARVNKRYRNPGVCTFDR